MNNRNFFTQNKNHYEIFLFFNLEIILDKEPAWIHVYEKQNNTTIFRLGCSLLSDFHKNLKNALAALQPGEESKIIALFKTYIETSTQNANGNGYAEMFPFTAQYILKILEDELHRQKINLPQNKS